MKNQNNKLDLWSLDIVFTNARLMWQALIQPVCMFYDRFHKVVQPIPQTPFNLR